MSRAPFMRKSGPLMQPKGSTEQVQPFGFIHPCWKDGCDEYAPFGYDVSMMRKKPGVWTCQTHLKELLDLRAHPARDEAAEAQHVKDGSGDLFGGAQ